MAAILGISAFYHDCAACLVRDGEIVAAAQEERFTRKKHDAALPAHAVAYCLARGGHQPSSDLDYVVFYDKPLLKFERMLETYLGVRAARARARSSRRCRVWLEEKLWTARDQIANARSATSTSEVLFTEHHESHAASAFYPVAVRGGGRPHASTASASGRRRRSASGEGNELELLAELRLPALARPALLGVHLLHRLPGQLRRVQADGARAVRRAALRRPDPRPADRPHATTARSASNIDYFDYLRRPDDDERARSTRSSAGRRASPSRRSPSARWTSRASIQEVTEEIVLRLARHVHARDRR